jgi:hypothetical protein
MDSVDCTELSEVDKAIERHFDSFRNGKTFYGVKSNIEPFIEGDNAKSGVVERIVKAIHEEEDSDVQEQAWVMLVFLGKRTNTLEYRRNILRNEEVIEAMIKSALPGHGPGSSHCIHALLKLVPSRILHKYDKELTFAFEEFPSKEMGLIMAKGKCFSARPILEKYIEDEKIGKREDMKKYLEIALAALGDEALEARYINEYKNEKDHLKKAEYVKYLGWIGTEKAVRTLAEDFRTDIIYEKKNGARISLRFDIQKALLFNYPEERSLVKIIGRDEQYEQIENFIEEEFGVEWKTERPPFFVESGVSIPLHRDR